MTPDLPTGTVTFLFTDIEGSTSLWEREPGRMQPALERHNAILSQAVAALVLVYFSSVVLLQALVGILTGQRQLAVVTVLSTLALAAAFVTCAGACRILSTGAFTAASMTRPAPWPASPWPRAMRWTSTALACNWWP